MSTPLEQNNSLSLENFNVNMLQEVQNKKEQQLQIVKDNPYIEIVDNETFTTAKKHRTALVSARTALQNEQKLVIKKVKENITMEKTVKLTMQLQCKLTTGFGSK